MAAGAPVAGSPIIAVLGASGAVGSLVVARALARGWAVRGQSRDLARLPDRIGDFTRHGLDPCDMGALVPFVAPADAVVFALGSDRPGPTTLFSDATRALIGAMEAAQVRRLVAITGVGAGETRGHGGFVYDRIVFPLFTRHRYRDKNVQESLIAGSDLDWTILRPAPFAARVPETPLEVHLRIAPDLRLTRITREEVAEFVIDEIETGRHIREAPFIGHR